MHKFLEARDDNAKKIKNLRNYEFLHLESNVMFIPKLVDAKGVFS